MRKICSIVIMCFLSLSSKGQNNLVLNGDFEDYSTCPDNFNQIIRAIPWFQPSYCGGPPWTWGGSTDYFNTCSSHPGLTPPDVLFGSQQPRSGNGFSGFRVFSNISQVTREYLEGVLDSPLISGKEYYVEYYLSLAENSGFAIRNVGVFFSQDTLVYCSISGDPIGLTPHILPIEPVIDSIGW